MIAAMDQEARCLAEAGFSVGDLETVEQEFFIEVDRVTTAAQDGGMALEGDVAVVAAHCETPH